MGRFDNHGSCEQRVVVSPTLLCTPQMLCGWKRDERHSNSKYQRSEVSNALRTPVSRVFFGYSIEVGIRSNQIRLDKRNKRMAWYKQKAEKLTDSGWGASGNWRQHETWLKHKTAKMQLKYEQKDADINLLMLRRSCSWSKQQHASRLIYYDRIHDLMMTCWINDDTASVGLPCMTFWMLCQYFWWFPFMKWEVQRSRGKVSAATSPPSQTLNSITVIKDD